jgi:hypothetical protein
MHVKVLYAERSKFQRQYDAKMNTILDRVSETMRGTTEPERLEPSLAAFKKKVQNVINGLIGEPLVKEVICTNVNYESL